MAHDKKRQRKARWKGELASGKRSLRIIVAIVMAVACAALAFTQLGFLGIGISGEYNAYAIVMLLPVALTALLLGALPGFLMGLFAGAMMYVHAITMPLDFYELTFITPLTSIIMLGIAGLVLGLLFRLALRNDPQGPRRIVYVCIVCFIVSCLYTIGFTINVFIQLIVDITSNPMIASFSQAEADDYVTRNAFLLAFRLGDVALQAWVDAVLMALCCSIAMVYSRYSINRPQEAKGLRNQFGTWLTVVVLIAFMITAGFSFAFITQIKINEAGTSMESEAVYLKNQLLNAESRGRAVVNLLEQSGADLSNLDNTAKADLLESISIEGLLDGYSPDADGTILILVSNPSNDDDGQATLDDRDYIILLTDDDGFPETTKLSSLVDGNMIAAIHASAESGQVCRVVYDETNGQSVQEALESNTAGRSEIAYLYAEEAEDTTVMVMRPASMVFSDRNATMTWTTISTFVLLAAVYAMVFLLLHRLVVRRIDETNDVLERITDGNLDERVNVRDTREFNSLTNGINTTVGALKGWIAEAETRMDTELATAKAIQESALPRIFPPYPDILKFDIYASMNAAKEVGGDFYDFFLIGNDSNTDAGKLGFVMADVSGKGVPAALFMMKAMTQIRDYLQSGVAVDEAIENANRQLCVGNDAGMFVTVWVGVLDYATGNVDFVNAGHNPPLLWQNPSGWRWITEKSGLPLGLFDGLPYTSYSVSCEIGDQFLLYTDGVTEAMSMDDELYGEERLEALANDHYTLHPRALVETVRRSVALHAKGAEQSDDITILSLEFGVPPEVTATLIVPADVSELPRVNEFIHTELDRRLCPLRVQHQLDIAVEELFVNVCHYAYPDADAQNPGIVRVSYTYSADPPSITVIIADEGIPYNPLAKPDAVTPDDIMDVPIGGLGILMAKRSVDEMHYERIDGNNTLIMTKKW